jgi:hypothetical protein
MRRVLPGLCFRVAACCCVLPLFLALASRDAHAQQRSQALPDLELQIRLNEAVWEPRSALPERVIPFCVNNVGPVRSGAAALRVMHRRIAGPIVYEFAIHSLAPNEGECDLLRITARPEWRGSQTFVGLVGVEHDSNRRNNESWFTITFPANPPRIVDLKLEVYWPSVDYSREQLIVTFEVANVGNVGAPKTKVGIWITGGERLDTRDVPPLAVNQSIHGELRIPVPKSWIGSTRDFTVIVDPDRSIGDANRQNNSVAFPVTFRLPATSWSEPAGPGGGSLIGAIIVVGALIALVIWAVRKQNKAPQSAPQPAKPVVRALAHPDAGTQSIRLDSDDVVLPDLRFRPVPDAGVQWIAFGSAEPGR